MEGTPNVYARLLTARGTEQCALCAAAITAIADLFVPVVPIARFLSSPRDESVHRELASHARDFRLLENRVSGKIMKTRGNL